MIKTDVIILGSGISGLVLSLLLKRRGIHHLVLDRTQKQKDMALAETLPPSAMPLLEELKLLELFEQTAIQKTYGYHAVWGRSQLQTTHFFHSNPYKYGLKIDKRTLRNAIKKLLRDYVHAYDMWNTVAITSEGVTVAISHQKEKQIIEGKLIVDATGRKRALLHALQIPIQEYDDVMAFSCHLPKVKQPPLIHEVYTESFAEGWGIVSGLNEKTQVMTLFTHKDTGLHHQLSEYTNWKSILDNTHYLKGFLTAETPDSIRGGRANSSAPEYCSGTRWLAIGDAAMAFDPMSSHGITNAVFTAKRAAALIDTYPCDTSDYHRDLQGIFTAYLKTRNHIYQSERRWAESVFWKRFQEEVEA